MLGPQLFRWFQLLHHVTWDRDNDASDLRASARICVFCLLDKVIREEGSSVEKMPREGWVAGKPLCERTHQHSEVQFIQRKQQQQGPSYPFAISKRMIQIHRSTAMCNNFYVQFFPSYVDIPSKGTSYSIT